MTAQRRALVFFGLSVVMGMAASALSYQWLRHVEHEIRNERQGDTHTRQIVVASDNLPAGASVSSDMVRLVSLPEDSLPEGSFGAIESISGRVLLHGLQRNEALVEAKLAPVEVTTGGVTALTHQEKRAMAVRVDDVVAVAGFVKPGDRVDVLATMHADGARGRSITKIALENVVVLATGTEMEKRQKNAKSADTPAPYSVVTLEVTPDEAEKLALATSEGRVHLALRNPLSQEGVETKGATVHSLLGLEPDAENSAHQSPTGLRSPPAAAPPLKAAGATRDLKERDAQKVGQNPLARIEIIRGGDRSEVRF